MSYHTIFPLFLMLLSLAACGTAVRAVAIGHAFYPPDIGIELAKRELVPPIYRVLEGDLGLDIARATQTIGAALAAEEEAGLLGVKVGDALIALERLTTAADGRPLEFLRSRYLPQHFRFTVELSRRPPA